MIKEDADLIVSGANRSFFSRSDTSDVSPQLLNHIAASFDLEYEDQVEDIVEVSLILEHNTSKTLISMQEKHALLKCFMETKQLEVSPMSFHL